MSITWCGSKTKAKTKTVIATVCAAKIGGWRPHYLIPMLMSQQLEAQLASPSGFLHILWGLEEFQKCRWEEEDPHRKERDEPQVQAGAPTDREARVRGNGVEWGV